MWKQLWHEGSRDPEREAPMTKTLEEYMSLRYPVKLEPRDDGSFFATHPDLQGCMAQGATADEAVRNLRDSREVWIEASLRHGYSVPEPAVDAEYSGRLLLRMSPRLHAGLAAAATNESVSLNQLITGVLAQYLGGVQLRDLLAGSLERRQETVGAEARKKVDTIRTARSRGTRPVRSAARSLASK